MTGVIPECLTPRWYPLKSHPEQMRLIHSPARFKVVPAGRRSGKTERAKRNLIIQALRESAEGKWLDYRYFAAAPTRDQAKQIFWLDLKAMIPKALLGGPIRESDLSIPLITGAEIVVVGLDRPQRLEGRSWNGGVIDEIANVKDGAWAENIRPALADRKGWTWLIGVPEGRGSYFEMYQYAKSGIDPEWDGFTWVSADILDPAEIASARRTLDPLVFQQEMEASFVTMEGRAYYPFDRTKHAKPLFDRYNPRAPLLVAYDFNVEPGVAAICQEMYLPIQPDRQAPLEGLGVIGEVFIPRNSNTPAVCRRIMQDWGNHAGPVRLYGDATGGSRGSAKISGSDWELIRTTMSEAFGNRMDFRVPRANPQERVRVNAVNSLLMNADGDIRLMVDVNRCPNVMNDFDGVRLLKGGSGEIDKKADAKLSHMCFAAGTIIDLETGPCRIEEAPMTGRVRTWDGSYVDYDWSGKTISDADIVSVTISNGDVLYCTPWHQFLTNKGWVCANELKGLELKSWRSKLSRPSSRISMEHPSTSTERSRISSKHSTSRLRTFIESFGFGTTALSLMDITSIIKTVTGRITRSKIWNVSLLLNTLPTMKPKTKKVGGLLVWQDWNWHGLLLQSGIVPKKEWSGIGFKPTLCEASSVTGMSPLPARTAEMGSWQLGQAVTPLCSVARHARPVIGSTAGSITKTELASNAVRHSPSTSTSRRSIAGERAHQPLTVVAVESKPKSDVYCIHVPSTGCFALDNGAIVSNSDAIGYLVHREFPIIDRRMVEGRMVLG